VLNENLSLSSAQVAHFTGLYNPVITVVYALIIYFLLTGIAKASQKLHQ
jgi:hypothetical protein